MVTPEDWRHSIIDHKKTFFILKYFYFTMYGDNFFCPQRYEFCFSDISSLHRILHQHIYETQRFQASCLQVSSPTVLKRTSGASTPIIPYSSHSMRTQQLLQLHNFNWIYLYHVKVLDFSCYNNAAVLSVQYSMYFYCQTEFLSRALKFPGNNCSSQYDIKDW